ncbi:MAG TPA: LuxR C-terminal-related transcriptional regulator [Dehalococcoidia bacterium]|nr:LuxR C-terminal-related transcriptional regulator [Dehalococcoidia bacterium]
MLEQRIGARSWPAHTCRMPADMLMSRRRRRGLAQAHPLLEDAPAIDTNSGVACWSAPRRTLLADREQGRAPAPRNQRNILTTRESEVLGLIATGQTNQQIARVLGLSVRTVERHIGSIYEKLEVRGPIARAAATAYAIRNGIAGPSSPVPTLPAPLPWPRAAAAPEWLGSG